MNRTVRRRKLRAVFRQEKRVWCSGVGALGKKRTLGTQVLGAAILSPKQVPVAFNGFAGCEPVSGNLNCRPGKAAVALFFRKAAHQEPCSPRFTFFTEGTHPEHHTLFSCLQVRLLISNCYLHICPGAIRIFLLSYHQLLRQAHFIR